MGRTANLVAESSASLGTGNLTLAGALSGGYRTIKSIYADNEKFYFRSKLAGEWEVGLAHLTGSGATFVRDTIYESTNGNAAVDWGAGDKQIWVTVPSQLMDRLAAGYTDVMPLALLAGASYTSRLFEGVDGTLLSATYRAAIAATSVLGTITISILDASDDSVIVTATSIKGSTSVALTVNADAVFTGGVKVVIASSNGDAVLGVGMSLSARMRVD